MNNDWPVKLDLKIGFVKVNEFKFLYTKQFWQFAPLLA